MLCRYIPTFWRNVLPPSSGEKMEVASFSEMFIPIYEATQHHILEDLHLIAATHHLSVFALNSLELCNRIQRKCSEPLSNKFTHVVLNGFTVLQLQCP
jgi:hypothetical protein